MVQNHQLNHLPPTDLKNLYHLALSAFSLHFTEKTSHVTLTVFMIKLLGNYMRTDTHSEIIISDCFNFNFIKLIHKGVNNFYEPIYNLLSYLI